MITGFVWAGQFLSCHYRWLKRVSLGGTARAFWTMALMLMAMVARVDSGEAAQVKLLRIGTGGKTGVYYPIGKLIAQGITGLESPKAGVVSGEQGLPGIIGVAQNSAGSVANARAVAAGEIEAGLIQADVAFRAYHQQGEFAQETAARSLRVVASLYPEKLQIVTRLDAGIATVPDFRGKRVAIDEAGSGTLAVMRIVLAAYGLAEKDFAPVYLKPVFTTEKLTSGELQGFAIMAGVPMEAVSQLAPLGIRMVPIEPEIAAKISSRHPYLVPGTIPADVYPGIPATPSLQVHALLVVDTSLDDQTVYRLTEALWSKRTQALLTAGHPQGKLISLASALAGLSVPLHPGAERYYRERHMLP